MKLAGMMADDITAQQNSYEGYPLAIGVVTNLFVADMTVMGIVWGVGSLPAIVTSLLGGLMGDRFGPERALIFGTLAGRFLGAPFAF